MKKRFFKIFASAALLGAAFALGACQNSSPWHSPRSASASAAAFGEAPEFSPAELARATIVVNRVRPDFSPQTFKVYPEAGVYAANAIYAICKTYNADTELFGAEYASAGDMIDALRDRHVPVDFVIFAKIEKWESGAPEVTLALWRAADKKCVRSTRVQTYPALFPAGTPTQNLLERPLKIAISAWFNKPLIQTPINCSDATLRATIR